MSKSNYHMHGKSLEGGNRKKFKNGGRKRWLKARHRIRWKLLR